MSGAEFGAGYTVKKTILYAVISILITIAVCLAAAMVFSAGAPVSYIGAAGWIMCGITGLIGGMMSAKAIRKKCVLTGILCGFFAYVLLFMIGLIFGDGVIFSKMMIKLVICLLSGALGGFLGAGNKRRRSRSR